MKKVTLEDTAEMTVEERLALADAICESVGLRSEAELTDAERRELDRRAEVLGEHPGSGLPWETVRARILAS